MSFQLNLFGTTALADTQNDLFWGELEGEDGAPPVPPATPAAMALPQIDFHMVADRGLADTWKQRARDNALAIVLLKEIEEADRNASSPEQIVLSRFIGFGAGELANNLFPSGSDSARPGWEEIGEAINASTTDVERAGLKRATQYAHFTPELIVHALWNKVLQMGFRGGSVLEPGCGTGLFIAARPERLEGRIAFTGIENDLITARIARRLYPNQWIRSEDFTTVKLADGYDLAIGNPPFSNRTVRGPEGLGRLGLSLHDFFIARSVEALRPGGIAIFVTSRHTLDKTDSTARRTTADMADLVGAVRLPAGAMRDDAGTDVVVDVLVLRKRMIGDMADDETWLETGALADSNQGNGPLLINRYFLDHPEQVLGRHGWTTTQFGPDYTCDARADGRLDVMLPEALSRIGQDVRFPEPLDQRIVRPAGAGVLVGTAADGAQLKEGSYFVTKGVAELMGQSEAEVATALGDAVYLDPVRSVDGRDVWVTADEMLSGAVRTKLEEARDAARIDGRYARNVTALEAVQPADLRPSEITARLGAPWLPVSDIIAFTAEVLGVETVIYHAPAVACWTVEKRAFMGKAEATSVWGTERRHAGELLEDALTQASPKIWDVWRDGDGNEHRELNTQETEAAKEKLAAIRRAFETWVWQDGDRVERLVRLYNDTYNNLVARAFDGSHLRLPGASTTISLRPHQKRVIWRIIAAGGTYIAHAVGSGKTFSMVAAVMEQKRLGLISKAMIAVPGHCLAQMAREFLMLYPTARILVADETNFVKAKRQRFLARAATGNWDAIIITHDAFRFIPVEGDFERQMIEAQIASYEEVLESVDAADRLSRKRVESMKEKMQAKLEGLSARKDDLVHLGEIGIDQILVDEAQQFRKLSFATNQSDLKGVDPNGSQRAWDLFVKTRYLAAKNPERPLIMASGSPITNTLAEMWTVSRYMDLEALQKRYLHEFDAWAANFGETRTELELQPSGLYKPVTRFTEFVNVADLMAMYRDFADVVQHDDLRQYVNLPAIRGGRREIIVAPTNDNFRAYQKTLAARINAIEARQGRPQKGDDILLSVITDARHAAIDLRFVAPLAANDDTSKLNLMIGNVFRIWQETSESRYSDPETGRPYDLPGAVQMIFSDLGTESAMETRGFSAYTWIRDELIRLGVPRAEIAFMQHYRKSAAKQKLFGDLNAGRKRILIGSTATMGTGVNAQQRLKALHHLDVPWLVSDIIQREGRIERQGNQHAEIELYAYAQQGSVDATNWQLLERKQRFIGLAMSGDRSIRRIEDIGGEGGNQFAMAKALASGDARLMQKAGLEADLARLERLAAAHYDDQFAVKRAIDRAEREITGAERQIPLIEADIASRQPTKGDAFVLRRDKGDVSEREKAGSWLLSQVRLAAKNGEAGVWNLGRIGGFAVMCEAGPGRRVYYEKRAVDVTLFVEARSGRIEIAVEDDTKGLGLISRLEHALLRIDDALRDAIRMREEAQHRLPSYRARLGLPFAEQAMLDEKRAELKALEDDLAATATDEDPAHDDIEDREKEEEVAA